MSQNASKRKNEVDPVPFSSPQLRYTYFHVEWRSMTSCFRSKGISVVFNSMLSQRSLMRCPVVAQPGAVRSGQASHSVTNLHFTSAQSTTPKVAHKNTASNRKNERVMGINVERTKRCLTAAGNKPPTQKRSQETTTWETNKRSSVKNQCSPVYVGVFQTFVHA